MRATDRVRAAYARIRAVDRPEVWITLLDESVALEAAAAVDDAVSRGEVRPLAGIVAAIKDNIDVVGVPTTAACPAYSYVPKTSAPAVQRLVDAGAIVIGKTNLDQFATGLVGTRSPYGAVRDARNPLLVSGGSSSGSAVAVALGIVDVALGTDTAGSGRVPAAFQGIVGIKPTRGLVPTTGVVPASATYDCVTTFAPTLQMADAVMAIISGLDGIDPLGRDWPATAPLGVSARPLVAVPEPAALAVLSEDWRAAFDAVVQRLAGKADLVTVDIAAALEAARLLYEGAFVAERYAAVGEFIDEQPEKIEATVRQIVLGAKGITASALATDVHRVAELHRQTLIALAGCDALLLPTTSMHPTIAQVAAEPLAVNAQLGTFTNFTNLFDMCAVAIPAGQAAGSEFGVTLLGPAFSDARVVSVARLLVDEPAWTSSFAPPGIGLVVVGAHMSGMVLNHELTSRGARFVRPVQTSGAYRLFALPTAPAKPGLVRVDGSGVSIAGELWELPSGGLASLLAVVPSPLGFGRVQLSDGTSELGFLCESAAVVDAPDISHLGGWRAYVGSVTTSVG